MPYIKQEERKELDAAILPLIEVLKKAPPEKLDGWMNYTITKLLKNVYKKKYFSLNRAIGVLTSVLLEFYRRVVAPYEDEKIKENGDVE